MIDMIRLKGVTTPIALIILCGKLALNIGGCITPCCPSQFRSTFSACRKNIHSSFWVVIIPISIFLSKILFVFLFAPFFSFLHKLFMVFITVLLSVFQCLIPIVLILLSSGRFRSFKVIYTPSIFCLSVFLRIGVIFGPLFGAINFCFSIFRLLGSQTLFAKIMKARSVCFAAVIEFSSKWGYFATTGTSSQNQGVFLSPYSKWCQKAVEYAAFRALPYLTPLVYLRSA